MIRHTTAAATGHYDLLVQQSDRRLKRRHSYLAPEPLPHQSTVKHKCRVVSRLGLDSVAHSVRLLDANRTQVGGKGQYLELMRAENYPVPRFVCIDIHLLAAIEKHPVKANILEACITEPGLLAKIKEQDSASLAMCKDWLRLLDADQQQASLKDLSAFIASNTFYDQVKDLAVAREIRSRYDSLFPDQDQKRPVIVRSSGMVEDSFGQAQAGKYASEVHGEADIVRTSLKVMASGYQPQACSADGPQPMAQVFQVCIKCRFGGVVLSYRSLRDNTMVVSYAPGQASGAVSGKHGMIPHRYDIERNGAKFDARFTPGDIPTRIDLQPLENGSGYVEKAISNPSSGSDNDRLDTTTLQQLYEHVVTLEDLINGPVDVEFGIDDSTGALKLFQVRSQTRATGAMSFTMAAPVQTLIAGELISEGLCHGQAIFVAPGDIDPKTIAGKLPQGAIIMTHHSDEWLIAPEILKRVSGFVLCRGCSTDHIAIRLREAGKPCLVASKSCVFPPSCDNTPVTLVCGQFNKTSGGFLLKDDHTTQLARHQVQSVSTDYASVLKPGDRQPQEEPDIQSPDTGFFWLNQQNTRLLDYFRHDGVLNVCLSSAHPVQLSMSPKRAAVLQRLKAEVHQLLDDAGRLVKGFGQFLRLAEGGNPEDGVSRNPTQTNATLTALKNRLNGINAVAENQLHAITKHLHPGQELPSPGANFQQWLDSCQCLMTSLQTLHQLFEITDINSIHDLIFWIHREFVSQLTPVVLGSGLGGVKKITDKLTIINFVKEDKSGLLNNDCQAALVQLDCAVTCINMDDAVIANLKLGCHVGVIEMFRQAEGGKKRMQ